MFYKSPDYNTSNILLVDGYVPPTSEVEKILSNEGDSPYAASPYNAVNATLINNYSPPSSANHLTILSTGGAGVPSTQYLVVPSVLDGEKFGASKIILKYQLLGHHNNVLAISEKYLQANNYIPTLNLPVQLREYGDFSFVPMPSVQHFHRRIHALGIAKSDVSVPHIHNNSAIVRPAGFNAAIVTGNTAIVNRNRPYEIPGFVASLFGVTRIYNLKQYVSMNGRAVDTSRFGELLLQGGMRFLYVSGFNASIIGKLDALNTKETRTISLSGRAIQAPEIPLPNVSPRIIYVQTFVATQFGNTIVQFPPRPNGFIASSYGIAWVSHSPRYLTPERINGFMSGFARVVDKAQRIFHADSPKIPGGIFGDIQVKNTLRIISVKGNDQSLYGDWSSVYSNLSNVNALGFNAVLFGNTGIRNKTPSIAPHPLNSNIFGGGTFVSDRHRRINARGIGFSETERFGRHKLDKVPELNAPSILATRYGDAVISNWRRLVSPGGIDSLKFNADITVWFRYRKLSPGGFSTQNFATPKIEHGVRFIQGHGVESSVFGGARAWYRVRKLAPQSIYREFETNHKVGGTQFVKPGGFIATVFGQRIVPENQALYPLGFNAEQFSELNKIELHTRWVRATGFLTFGIQAGDRYGTPKVWNSRQYIVQVFDVASGLTPPGFGQWTGMANRNRVIKSIGQDSSRFGYSAANNNARPVYPFGLNSNLFGHAFISHRIRKLRPDSMEAPYLSGWGRIVNAADQIHIPGSKFDIFGKPSVLNTRREYRWVGAFESLQTGMPMVAFRIRKLSIESRYSISPIYMPLPKVDLYTRYVDTPGPDLSAFGGPSLHIKWNIITPRWTHRDYVGEPAIKNLTPELKQRGNSTDVFGQSEIRLQWRPLPLDGFNAILMGRPVIAYRDRAITVPGFNANALGQVKVTKTGAPPYSLQNINLDWDGEGLRPDTYEGKGIEIPKYQVSTPSLKTNVIFAQGFVATAFGSHHAQSNGIVMDSGIQEFAIGNHTIILRNRTIAVPTLGDLLGMENTRPRLSPHTIYAVMEATSQAEINHPIEGRKHFVNSDNGWRQPGEVFGRLTIALLNRKIEAFGVSFLAIGSPIIDLRRRYIRVNSFLSFRMGWHGVLDGRPQKIEQYESLVQTRFGETKLHIPYYGPQYIRPNGFNAERFSSINVVDYFNRQLKPFSFLATQMGYSRSGDTLYKPQSLWIGEPKPTIPTGFASEIFGKTGISLRVRDVGVIGFDSFSSEMDISNLKGRMKVELIKKPIIITSKDVKPKSFGTTTYGIPNIRLKTHYIRPDGNSDQYRKGGPK